MRPYYTDGSATIYHGDCREIVPALARADHVITDPPYSDQTHRGAQTQTRGRTIPLLTFASITPEVIAHVLDLANPKRWAILTCDWQHALPLATGCRRLRFVRLGAWIKPDGCPQFTGDRPACGWEAISILHSHETKLRWNDHGMPAVWTAHVGRGNEHPTQKPEPLITAWLLQFTDPGEVILDPFMGSGTTLAGAVRLGRKAIGIELEERYCEIAARRLEQSALPFWESPSAPPALFY